MTLTKTNKQQYITDNNEKLLQAVKFVSDGNFDLSCCSTMFVFNPDLNNAIIFNYFFIFKGSTLLAYIVEEASYFK